MKTNEVRRLRVPQHYMVGGPRREGPGWLCTSCMDSWIDEVNSTAERRC